MSRGLSQVAPQSTSGTTRLHLTITDESERVIEGNVFVCLEHIASGATWRTLHWHARSRSFRFDALPIGRFAYRAWSSAEQVANGEIELDTGDCAHRVILPSRPARPRLELPVDRRLAQWQARVRSWRIEAGGDAEIRSRLDANCAGSVLYDLIQDDTVIAAITRPLSELGVSPALHAFIDAYTQPGQGPNVLSSRTRFVIVTLWITLSPGVRRRLAPRATDDDIWSALLRVTATIDDADLDDLFKWAARLYRPDTALLDQFARAWAERFNGLNNLRTHIPARRPAPDGDAISMPELPIRPAPVRERSLRDICAPMLADAAHIVQVLGASV